MGSFSYAIETKDKIENIVYGDRIYVSCGDKHMPIGEYLDYGLVTYKYGAVDLHTIEGIMILDKLDFYSAVEKAYGIVKHSLEDNKYRNASIDEFYDKSEKEIGQFSFIKLSKTKNFDSVINNFGDPEQGFYKWVYNKSKGRFTRGNHRWLSVRLEDIISKTVTKK